MSMPLAAGCVATASAFVVISVPEQIAGGVPIGRRRVAMSTNRHVPAEKSVTWSHMGRGAGCSCWQLPNSEGGVTTGTYTSSGEANGRG